MDSSSNKCHCPATSSSAAAAPSIIYFGLSTAQLSPHVTPKFSREFERNVGSYFCPAKECRNNVGRKNIFPHFIGIISCFCNGFPYVVKSILFGSKSAF
jgi:hypothetical protein